MSVKMHLCHLKASFQVIHAASMQCKASIIFISNSFFVLGMFSIWFQAGESNLFSFVQPRILHTHTKLTRVNVLLSKIPFCFLSGVQSKTNALFTFWHVYKKICFDAKDL